MFDSKEFEKYATMHAGINSNTLNSYVKNLTPNIIEERQLNVAQMDVFSRLMMDRIIFLGTGINDQVANIVQAQLLFLQSVDAKKRHSKFTLTPQEVRYTLVWEFMIPCNTFSQMLQRFVPGWQHPWELCCCVQEQMERDRLLNTRG